MIVFISSCCGSFLLGVSISMFWRHQKEKSSIFKVKRFYPTLPLAREVYNTIGLQFDKQFSEFKLLKMDISFDKKQRAYSLVAKYKSLNGKRFSF